MSRFIVDYEQLTDASFQLVNVHQVLNEVYTELCHIRRQNILSNMLSKSQDPTVEKLSAAIAKLNECDAHTRRLIKALHSAADVYRRTEAAVFRNAGGKYGDIRDYVYFSRPDIDFLI